MMCLRSTAFCGREELLFTCTATYIKQKETKKHDGSPLSSAYLYFQGASDDTRLLHAGVAAGLLPDEAEEADPHLHLQPTQRVPGGPTMPPYRRRHQAQGDAAHLPELAPVHADRDRAACSQPEVTRRR